jgi:hypothetical protein
VQTVQARSDDIAGASSSLNCEPVTETLDRAIAEFHTDRQAFRSLQRIARQSPDIFIPAATKHLDSNPESPARRFLLGLLLWHQEPLFRYLANPALCPRDVGVRLFRFLLALDPTIDFKFARHLPGRNASGQEDTFTGAQAARAIDILDQTSEGQRLMSVVGHLPNSEDPAVSAKAALFVGHRVNNPAWTAKQLVRKDDRLRANAIEAAWGAKTEPALRMLRDCVDDKHNRVAGNALIGMHMAGCPDAAEKAFSMSESEEPLRRSTAAWAMGKIASPVFVDRLSALVRDPHRQVRSTAIRSLVEIGRAETERHRVAEQQITAVPRNQPSGTEPTPPLEEPQTTPELRLDGSSFAVRRK